MAAQEAAFMSKYPDYANLANDGKFVDWVTSSPLRQRAAALARDGDFVIADELLTEYGVFKGTGPQPVLRDAAGNTVVTTESTEAELEAARKAGTVSAAQASVSQTGAVTSKQLYRRSELIRLKQERPEVYGDPVFQAEIMAAYVDGRVR